MNSMKEKIINSFRLAKNDIMKLQRDVIALSQAQEKIMKIIEQMRANELQMYRNMETMNKNMQAVSNQVVKKKAANVVTRRAAKKTHFVASKTGKKFHVPSCPFAQNIKPKSKVTFKSKAKALNQGLKPCNCVK